MTTKNLLLIEDDLILGESLVQRFELEGVKVVWVRRLAEAQGQMEEPWVAVVSDVRLPEGLATQWFTQLSAARRQWPWFFLTRYRRQIRRSAGYQSQDVVGENEAPGHQHLSAATHGQAA